MRCYRHGGVVLREALERRHQGRGQGRAALALADLLEGQTTE